MQIEVGVADAVRQAFSPSHIAPLLLSLAGGPPGSPPRPGDHLLWQRNAGCQPALCRPGGLRYRGMPSSTSL